MPDPVDLFIARWEASGAAERANYALFLSELCDLLDVPRPDPTSPDPAKNRYVFERAVTRVAPDGTSSSGFIDLTWPDKLPEQVTRIRSLLPELGTDPAALSARFGRANKKREEQIAAILETLRGLGL